MGWALLAVVVLVGALVVIEHWIKHRAKYPKPRVSAAVQRSPAPAVSAEPRTPVRFRDPEPVEPNPLHPFDVGSAPLEVGSWVSTARHARERGDLGAARLYYQKAAYAFAQLSEAQNKTLKAEIALFAMGDTLYIEGMELVREQLDRTPGMLQSDLGKSVGDAREALNYVLYYADLLGAVVRVKSGRSYRLYLPGQEIPEPPPSKPRRSRSTGAKPKS